MMAKDRADRYATMPELIGDVEQVLRGEDPENANIEVGKSSVKVSAKRYEKVQQRAAAQPKGRRAPGAPAIPTHGVRPGAHDVPGGELVAPRARSLSADAAATPRRRTRSADYQVVSAPVIMGGEDPRQRRTTGPQPPVAAGRRAGGSERAETGGRARNGTFALLPLVGIVAGGVLLVMSLAIMFWPRPEHAVPAKVISVPETPKPQPQTGSGKAGPIRPPATPVTPPAPNNAQPLDVCAPARWADAVNLLARIDPGKDTVSGTWRFENGKLVSGGKVDAKPNSTRLEIPYQPPAEYDVRITFVRRQMLSAEGGGDVNIVLSKAGRPFTCMLGGFNNSYFGFELINGRRCDKNASGVKFENKCLTNGQTHTAIASVREQGVKAYLDGRLVTQWNTNYQDMSNQEGWQLRNPALIGLATYESPTVFERVELLDVTGKGKFTR